MALRVSFGQGGTPTQWYLPGTDTARLPPGSASGTAPVADALTDGPHAPPWDDTALFGGLVEADTLGGTAHSFDVIGGWNSVKNAFAQSDEAEELRFDGFVQVDLDVGRGDARGSAITVIGAKRGNIVTGEGGDIIRVETLSNEATWNDEFRITAGGGNDVVEITFLDRDRELAAGDRTYAAFVNTDGAWNTSGDTTATFVDLGAGNDRFIGHASTDTVTGGDGDDLINGDVQIIPSSSDPRGTDRTIFASHDILKGGNGNDWIVGDSSSSIRILAISASDHLEGGAGDDTLFGDADGFVAVPGNDVIRGDDGNDTLYGDGLNRTFPGNIVSMPPPPPPGGWPRGDDLLDGGSGDDTVYGDAVGASFSTQTGNDTIRGGDGNDQLFGDVAGGFSFSAGSDWIDGGTGDDTIWGDGEGDDNGSDSRFASHAQGDTLLGGDGNDTIYGDFAVTLSSSAADDRIDAGSGNDLVYGDGVEQYATDMGDDTIAGGEGDDILYGDAAEATAFRCGGCSDEPGSCLPVYVVFGDAGRDEVRGGAGNDTIYGDAVALADGMVVPRMCTVVERFIPGADDLLDGGAGADTMTGGPGDDTFVLRAGETEGDAILDFEGAGVAGGDLLRFEGFASGAAPTHLGNGLWRIGGEAFTLDGVTTLDAGDYVMVA